MRAHDSGVTPARPQGGGVVTSSWHTLFSMTIDAGVSVPELPPELIDAVRGMDCVPFLGAGISRPSGMLGWADIVGDVRASVSQHLGYDVGPNELDFLQVPQVYSSLVGSHALNRHLDEAFAGGFVPNAYHRRTRGAPYRHVPDNKLGQASRGCIEGRRHSERQFGCSIATRT